MAPRYIDNDELQARENEILDQAIELIAEQGIAFLTIDKLVGRVNYSKGTIYNHFSSKEDVLTALCNRSMQNVLALIIRAKQLDVSARRKMTAVIYSYMLSVLMFPQHFVLVMSAKTEMFAKASTERREEHEELDGQLFEMGNSIVSEAVENGELILKEGQNAEEVTFAFWANSFGTIALLFSGEGICSTQASFELEDRVLAHADLLMDGFAWQRSEQKLSDDEFLNYLKSEVYVNELQQLSQT